MSVISLMRSISNILAIRRSVVGDSMASGNSIYFGKSSNSKQCYSDAFECRKMKRFLFAVNAVSLP